MIYIIFFYKKTLVCQFDIEIVQSSISNVAFDIVICGLWFLRPNAKIDQADPQIFEFKISKIKFRTEVGKRSLCWIKLDKNAP